MFKLDPIQVLKSSFYHWAIREASYDLIAEAEAEKERKQAQAANAGRSAQPRRRR